MTTDVTSECLINGVQFKCRTCFDPGRIIYPLTDEASGSKTWFDLLKEIAQLQTNDDELLPKTLCCKCLEKLKKSYDFVIQIQDVNKRYAELLTKDGVVNEVDNVTDCLAESAIALPLEQYIPEIKMEEELVVSYNMDLSGDNKFQERNSEKFINEDTNDPFTETYDENVKSPSEKLNERYYITEKENNNCGIKEYQLCENLKPNYNSHTHQNYQNWEAKFDLLTATINQLKDTIEKLAATSFRQNTITMKSFAMQKGLTRKLIGKEKEEANVRNIFPIKTVDDLSKTNNQINDTNRALYINYMSSLLKGNLHKSLTEIFSMNVIIASNMNGIHGKLSLKNFKKLFDALIDAVRANGEENPEETIRNALKVIKKRHFQAICVNKKKETKINIDHKKSVKMELTT